MSDERHEDPSAPEWRVPEEQQLESDAYHIWKPRPLLRSIHWKPRPLPSREAAAGAYEVFVDQRAFAEMHGHVWTAAADEEPFGFLVGDLCEDPDSSRRYLIISTAIPSRFSIDKAGPEHLPAEAIVAMQLEVDRRRGVLAGWYHRHRSGAVVLTEADLAMHGQHLKEPWQVALLFITDPEEPAGGCFRRARGGLSGDTPLPFFEMVSNESLLAHGVRRSLVDWVNVETVDSIQPEVLPRPESVPEVGLGVEPAEIEPEVLPEDEVEPAPEIAPEEEIPDTGLSAPEGIEPEPVAPAEAGFPPVATAGDRTTLAEEEEFSDEEVTDEQVSAEAVDAPLEDLLADAISNIDEGPTDEPALDELDEDLESLPVPGWDEDQAGQMSEPETVDDYDLASFVEEVEAAELETLVEAQIPPADFETRPPEPVEEIAEVDLVLEPVAPPSTEVRQALESAAVEAASIDAPVEAPLPSSRGLGGRRLVFIVSGLIVVTAVVVSLIALLGRPGSQGAGGPTSQTAGQIPALDAGGPPATTPTEGAPGVDAASASVLAGVDSAENVATAEQIETLAEELLAVISQYYGRAVALDDGRATCAELQEAYVEVENRWIAYNVDGKARYRGRLPPELETRDARLYSGVQDVEREFDRSGCERP